MQDIFKQRFLRILVWFLYAVFSLPSGREQRNVEDISFLTPKGHVTWVKNKLYLANHWDFSEFFCYHHIIQPQLTETDYHWHDCLYWSSDNTCMIFDISYSTFKILFTSIICLLKITSMSCLIHHINLIPLKKKFKNMTWWINE